MTDLRIEKELEAMADLELSEPELTKMLGLEGKTKEQIIADLKETTDKQLEKHKKLADVLDTRGKQNRHELAKELRLGHYLDFASPYATPSVELYTKLIKTGDKDLAENVTKGVYD